MVSLSFVGNKKGLLDYLENERSEECAECGGIGYVATMERVSPGEPHMAPIGERPCPECSKKEED